MDDIYIQVLKYAKNNPGFTIDEFRNKFPGDNAWIEREYQFSKLFQTDVKTQKIYLSFEDRFRLLEHEELIEARKSAKIAMRVAIISIALTFASIVYQYFVISSVKVINFSDAVSIHDKTHDKSLNRVSAVDVTSD